MNFLLFGLSLLVFGFARSVYGDCVRADSLREVRDEIIDEVQSQSRLVAELHIVLDKLQAQIDQMHKTIEQNIVNSAQQQQPTTPTAVSNNVDVLEDRFRSLESSVSSIQRKLDEKLESSMQKVVSVEARREEQEKVFTDILKKILNSVNTVYEMVHRGKANGGTTAAPPGVQRSSVDSAHINYIQSSLESNHREFKEKLDILQSKLTDSIEAVYVYARIASDKANYISENMLFNDDLQRMGENTLKVDTEKVLNVVREEVSRCTRAVVNAPPLTKPREESAQFAIKAEASTAMNEMTFYVGSPRDDCKMTAAVKVPHNCDELSQNGANCDGPYMVYDSDGSRAMKVVCDMSGGRWTILMRRGVFKGKPLSFDRTWSSYKHGFGNIMEEFYIGNEYIHRLTQKPKLLRIELEAFSGETLTLDYANFTMGPESDSYRMGVGKYMGNNLRVGNSFKRHHDKIFMTRDRLSGAANSHPCPTDHKVGFWWHSCYSVLLTGEYATPETANDKNGIRWPTWKAAPLKSVVMKIRDME